MTALSGRGTYHRRMIPAQRERRSLADLFDEVGPDAPTLCEGWRARDLAAHLVLRERRPDASAGILVRPLSGYTARVQSSIRDGQPWDRLVERVRNGPPFPISLPPIDATVNTVEYFVHHEDVRRAQADWSPRELGDGTESALWRAVSLLARVLVRRSPVGVRLEAPGRGEMVAKTGSPAVTVAGAPGELVLWAFGRGDAANVAFDGEPDAQRRLARARLGL